jgi:uncharacterized membrane protein YpjA
MSGQFEGLVRGTMQFILRWPLIFWSCVIANLFGTVVGGWLWYGPMLQVAPLWALPFIPDCPLGSLLGTVGLLALRFRRQWSWFYALTAFACMKYGAWTVIYWLRAWSIAGFSPDIFQTSIEMMLFVTHIGLFIEGMLFVPFIGRLSLPGRLGVIAFFLLSIYVDYGLGWHPPLGPVSPAFVGWLAVLLTALLSVGLLLLPARQSHPRAAPAPYAGLAE